MSLEIVTIKSPGPDGPREQRVVGEPVGEYLAVTPVVFIDDDGQDRLRGDWCVTHKPTGYRFPRSDRDVIDDAVTLAERLDALDVDWTPTDAGELVAGCNASVVEVLTSVGDDDLCESEAS